MDKTIDLYENELGNSWFCGESNTITIAFRGMSINFELDELKEFAELINKTKEELAKYLSN